MQVFGRTRLAALRIGARQQLGDALLHVSVEQLREHAADVDSLRALAARQRAQLARDALRKPVPRFLLSDGRVFFEGALDDDDHAREADDADGAADGDGAVLRGMGVSAGVATGRVVVVTDPHKHGLRAGDVMVCQGTDPSWTPLFMLAGALVSELGGAMTHGAIVARELGLPAVTGVRAATRRLRTGDRATINGSSGKITVIERAAS